MLSFLLTRTQVEVELECGYTKFDLGREERKYGRQLHWMLVRRSL